MCFSQTSESVVLCAPHMQRCLQHVSWAARDPTSQTAMPGAATRGLRATLPDQRDARRAPFRDPDCGEVLGDNHRAPPKTAPVELLVRLRGVDEREHLGLHVDGAGSGELEVLEQF
jgi:hypothetical protein